MVGDAPVTKDYETHRNHLGKTRYQGQVCVVRRNDDGTIRETETVARTERAALSAAKSWAQTMIDKVETWDFIEIRRGVWNCAAFYDHDLGQLVVDAEWTEDPDWLCYGDPGTDRPIVWDTWDTEDT